MSVSIYSMFEALSSAFLVETKHIPYPVGNRCTRPTHIAILYGVVYFCTACGATAGIQLAKLFDPYILFRHGSPTPNLSAYKACKSPQGFLGWL